MRNRLEEEPQRKRRGVVEDGEDPDRHGRNHDVAMEAYTWMDAWTLRNDDTCDGLLEYAGEKGEEDADKCNR